MHSDYNLTPKPISGCIPCAHSARAMKKCGAVTREEAAFPNLAYCDPCRNSGRARNITAYRTGRQSCPRNGRPEWRRANGFCRTESFIRRRRRRLRGANQENARQIMHRRRVRLLVLTGVAGLLQNSPNTPATRRKLPQNACFHQTLRCDTKRRIRRKSGFSPRAKNGSPKTRRVIEIAKFF